ADAFDRQRDGRGGDNVIDQINHFAKVLADRSAPKDDRAEALRFLVHFVGDVHQPLHCAERNADKGGNGRLVFFLDRKKAVSLHTCWDSLILLHQKGNVRNAAYADQLNARIARGSVAQWEKGTPVDWANES